MGCRPHTGQGCPGGPEGSDPKRQPVRDFGETPRLGGASSGQGLVCQTPLGWSVACV